MPGFANREDACRPLLTRAWTGSRFLDGVFEAEVRRWKAKLQTSLLHLYGVLLVILHSADNTNLLVVRLEHRALLDMQLKVRGHRRREVACGNGA